LATSPSNPNIFVDDPGKLDRQRRRAIQAKGLETLDPIAEVDGPSKSPRESPPPCPKKVKDHMATREGGVNRSRYKFFSRNPTYTLVRTMCGSRTGGWSLPCVMSD
jgi:hypothetical protein